MTQRASKVSQTTLPAPENLTPPNCGDCQEPMVLRSSENWGKFWGCSQFPACHGTHGAHPKTGEPLGIPADAATRAARAATHELFDQLWKTGAMSRRAAYGWLRTVMFLTTEQAHIAMFTREQCDRLIALLEEKTGFKPNS